MKIKEKYNFLNYIEKENGISFAIKLRRMLANTTFLTGAGLVLSTLAVPAKHQLVEWALASGGFATIIGTSYIIKSIDDIRIEINPKVLGNYLKIKWLESQLDEEIFDFCIEKGEYLNVGYFLDSDEVDFGDGWKSIKKSKKELEKMFEEWTFSEHKADFEGCEDKKINVRLYDLYSEINTKPIPDEIKYPIFYEYVRHFGSNKQLEFVRRYREHSALLPEMSNIIMMENITREKLQREYDLRGETRDMNRINEIVAEDIRKYTGCNMEIPYYATNEVVDRFLEQLVFTKLETI